MAVLVAASPQDVATAVRYAGERGLRVSVQAIGHGASTHLDDTLLIRTAALDEIWIDAELRVARVGAGVTWEQLLSALDGTGLTALPGSNPMINVVAFSLGGGLSLLSRAYGNAAGMLRAAEVVCADGEHVWVSDASHPELMWALRGGGGDFAVVTAVEIDLVPSALSGGRLEFSAAESARLAGPFSRAVAAADPRSTLMWTRTHFPDIPMLPPPLRGARLLHVDGVHAGPVAELRRLLAEVTDGPGPVRDTLAPRSPSGLAAICEEPTDPSPGASVALLVDAVTPPLLAALDTVMSHHPALLQVHVRTLGGALDEPAGRPGAYGSRRGAALVLALGKPVDEESRAAVEAGFAEVTRALAPWRRPGRPYTFLAPQDPTEDAFDPETLERLRATKTLVDPYGTIRSNHPVDAHRTA